MSKVTLSYAEGILEKNDNILATAKQLGIAMQTLSNWQNKANEGYRIVSAC
ncbi:hypothetical protein ACT3RN_03275 [Psychrobacter sp. AOP5-GZ1-6]|uniref:hypothetical protein n=1 Tax=Psychrobacter sp. AOP5-GZ1-6 TaxID=3457649 RepID=UPI00402BBE23